MITTHTIATPHGAFTATWGSEEGDPPVFAGSADAMRYFDDYLALAMVVGAGGRLLRRQSLEPVDVAGFCESETYGITIMPGALDVDDDVNDGDAAPALDGISPMERVQLTRQLSESVAALGSATSPLARIRAARETADLIARLTGKDEPDAITKDEASTLFSELKRLNADTDWSGGDGYRYEAFAKRIDAASEGVPGAVKWAREWLDELSRGVEQVVQQESENAKFYREQQERYAAELAAGRSENPLYQAWLDTLEDPSEAKNYEYMAWNNQRGAEFSKQWKGQRLDIRGRATEEYQAARTAYFRQWADEHLSERVKAQRADRDPSDVAGDPEGTLIVEPGEELRADAIAEPASLEIIEHVTGRGKTLRGVVRTDLTYAEAKAIDEYTFKKNGGFFIREKYLRELAERPAGTATTTKQEPSQEELAQAEAARLANEQLRIERKRAEQANKLRAAAESTIAKAEEELGRDRLANTARRANMAASISARNEQARALGKTMLNLAAAIESGEAKHLSGITSRAAVEVLHNSLVSAMTARDSKRWTYAESQMHRGRAPDAEDAALASYPAARWDSAGASRARILELLKGKRGAKELADRIRYSTHATSDDIDNLIALIGKKEAESQLGWWNIEVDKRARSLRRAGITNTEELRAALVEYLQFREGARKEDPIKAAERAILGQKVGIDFFPTPSAQAQRMVQLAEIKPGDRVLEPSAGNGNIADAAAAAGAQVDVVEISSQLRDILKAKGYEVVAHDFMEYQPSEKYDAVLMNPPFSNRLDAAHIMRAYEMVKPGGRLVAIAGEGVFFGSDQKAVAFREWLEHHAAEVEQLPAGTFTDNKLLARTSANGRMLVMEKR